MIAFLDLNLFRLDYWLTYPWLAIFSIFQLWMLIDA